MRYLLFLFLNISPLIIIAQEQKQPKEFTYFNDRIFIKVEDFFGYTFVPSKGKLTNANFEDPIKLASVMIAINSSTVFITERLVFTTSGIKGEIDSKPYQMSIARSQQVTEKKSNFFELTLVDIHNPNIQGYLKFYTDKGNCFKILYRPEAVASERTFYLAVPPNHIEGRDSRFFTHEQDIVIKELDSLAGNIIFPFSEYIDQSDYRDFTRIYPDDKVNIKVEGRKIKKGRKEKTVYYLVINDGRKDAVPMREFLIKKTKDYLYKDYFIRQERDCMVLYVFDNEDKKEKKVYLFRNNNTKKLNAIRIDNMEFAMRPGKRLTK
jgi:hypothetical protein